MPAPRQKLAQPERAVLQRAAAREALTTSLAAALKAPATQEPGQGLQVAELEELALQQARAVGPAGWEWPAGPGGVRVGEVALGVRSVERAAHRT